MQIELEKLLENASNIEMNPVQLREQRQSFVYGNTHIENTLITRTMVIEADKEMTVIETDKEIEQGRKIVRHE
jgi:hypothetical protein